MTVIHHQLVFTTCLASIDVHNVQCLWLLTNLMDIGTKVKCLLEHKEELA